jgi:hypothetical protein
MNLRIGTALLALPLLFSATSAFAGFHGAYTLVFFEGPSHSETGSECVSFKHTGSIEGFSNSGTWTSSTFPGWGGNFVIDHGNLRFYGTYNSGGGATNFYAQVNGTTVTGKGFDEWVVSDEPITPTSDGTIAMSAGCGAAAAARPRHSSPGK